MIRALGNVAHTKTEKAGELDTVQPCRNVFPWHTRPGIHLIVQFVE